MRWTMEEAGSRQYNWTKAWWGSVAVPKIDGQSAYIMTLRGKEGLFICTYSGIPYDYEPHYGPFETLELAQLAYELMI